MIGLTQQKACSNLASVSELLFLLFLLSKLLWFTNTLAILMNFFATLMLNNNKSGYDKYYKIRQK